MEFVPVERTAYVAVILCPTWMVSGVADAEDGAADESARASQDQSDSRISEGRLQETDMDGVAGDRTETQNEQAERHSDSQESDSRTSWGRLQQETNGETTDDQLPPQQIESLPLLLKTETEYLLIPQSAWQRMCAKTDGSVFLRGIDLFPSGGF